MESVSGEVVAILRQIPGVVGVAPLTHQQKAAAIRVESDYERTCALRVHNLGVALLANHSSCVAVLKDSTFRPPRQPTVYLVEEADRPGSPNQIEVAGRRFEVVGQEISEADPLPDETMVTMDESFVIFPDRRSGPAVPCFFLLPPLPFPELESRAARLGIRDIISVSPSLAADTYVRETFGFPPTNALATILIGYNRAVGGA